MIHRAYGWLLTNLNVIENAELKYGVVNLINFLLKNISWRSVETGLEPGSPEVLSSQLELFDLDPAS